VDRSGLTAGRLGHLLALTSRLAVRPLGLRRPAWIPDAGFDVRRHLEHWTLAPAGEWAGRLRLAGDLHARLLPRDWR
jgi:hypothetical protein